MKKLPSIEFPALLIIAMIVAFLPIVNLPFRWFNTYFHEISHGIAALITGGSIKYIELNYTGSGVCAITGGFKGLIAFAGYAGAILWGMAIYIVASRLNKYPSIILTIFIVLSIALTIFFFANNIVTTLILSLIAIVLFLIAIARDHIFMRLGLKFSGIYILVSSMLLPMSLIGSKHGGDGANLANITSLPEVFWIVIWVLMAVFGLRQMWIWDVRKNTF